MIGFLKIPFGIYKENNFTNVFSHFLDHFQNYKTNLLNNKESHFDYMRQEISEKTLNIQKISHFSKDQVI